jgi:hypothetical protein
MQSNLEQQVNDLTKETSGAGFYITTNGNNWTVNITKNQTTFTGTLQEVLEAYVCEIKEHRYKKTNQQAIKKFTYQ